MLARTNRFHGHGAVRRVYRTGKPVRGGVASLHVARSDKARRTKAAVVVSKKVDKSAVKRNRIRRRIYEIVRRDLDKIQPPAELVITVYQADIATMPAEKLQAAMAELFKKAKL